MRRQFFFRKMLFAGITIGGVAFGQETSQELRHSFGLAVEHAHYHYIEPDVYQSFVNEEDRRTGAIWAQWKGNTWGGSAFYRLTWQDKLFTQPEIRILYGKHQYNFGAKEVIFGKTKHAIPSLIFEPRLIMGGHLPSYRSITLSPYSGIGYRFKSDDGDDVTLNNEEKLGFYRKSHYVYVPLGAAANYALNDTWSLAFKGEYDWIVKAWQYTRHPTVIPRPLVNKQPNGYGLKGEVSIAYLYKKVKFSLTPYVNYWNIRNSDRKEGAREPYNITWETGLKLGVTF